MERIGLIVCLVRNREVCRMIRYSGLPCRKSDCLPRSLCYGYTLSVNMAVWKSICFGGTVSVIWQFADKCDCATIPMFLDFLRDCCTKMLISGKIMQ